MNIHVLNLMQRALKQTETPVVLFRNCIDSFTQLVFTLHTYTHGITDGFTIVLRKILQTVDLQFPF